MPLQNRVRPDGEIVSSPARGILMGNRGGKLHDPETRTLVRTQSSRQWITCVLQFKARQRQVMGKGYTELFFMDEVTALAAGHRPCFECRRKDALLFRSAWQSSKTLTAPPSAPDMDRELSAERRMNGGAKITWTGRAGTLPDGAMVRIDDNILAIRDRKFLPWTASGYRAGIPLDLNLDVEVLTPPTIARILHAGYQPIWHPSIRDAGD
ncbi:hypothetical protein [Anderseniella sp. Alg231-50]|uniref:hypothetical protein n=1 Tax=Anderseniella sp. Alg231-50 TaxID=1922226 RepID=UPI000D553316